MKVVDWGVSGSRTLPPPQELQLDCVPKQFSQGLEQAAHAPALANLPLPQALTHFSPSKYPTWQDLHW